MKVLALDTAAAACSVAVRDGGDLVAHRFEAMARGQAEALVPMIRDTLEAAGLAATDLDLLAVTVGPGAFTGLRIGLATARGLALAAALPIRGVTTLECLAAAVPVDERSGPVLAVMDTKRGDFYAQVFDAAGAAQGAPLAATGTDLCEMVGPGAVLVGDGAAALAAHFPAGTVTLSTASAYPDAGVLAALAVSPGRTAYLPPDPLYIRPPEAKIPAGGGKLRP